MNAECEKALLELAGLPDPGRVPPGSHGDRCDRCRQAAADLDRLKASCAGVRPPALPKSFEQKLLAALEEASRGSRLRLALLPAAAAACLVLVWLAFLFFSPNDGPRPAFSGQALLLSVGINSQATTAVEIDLRWQEGLCLGGMDCKLRRLHWRAKPGDEPQRLGLVAARAGRWRVEIAASGGGVGQSMTLELIASDEGLRLAGGGVTRAGVEENLLRLAVAGAAAGPGRNI